MAEENGNGRATIREVYAIAQRIEDKIDAHATVVERRLDSLEGWQASVKTSGAFARGLWAVVAAVIAGSCTGLIVSLTRGA